MNQELIYLCKSGNFYLFIDEDAKRVHEDLGLKLTPLDKIVLKCGFPISELKKYEKFMKLLGYKYEIIYLGVEQILYEIKEMNMEEITRESLKDKIMEYKKIIEEQYE